MPHEATLDPAEVARFGALAEEWWDPNGKFRPLHELGPERVSFIRDAIKQHFAISASDFTPLKGIRICDIGCGGGLICEPLARIGADVTGIDPAADSIAAATAHATASGLSITYRSARAEDLASEGAQFDVVTCLEVIEHVPDVAAFIALLSKLVRPGGLLVLSTINRTLKSYALAIVMTEYVLSWVPRGTHQWNRFVTPDELRNHLVKAGLASPHFEGMVYNPLTDRWTRAADLDVNYMAAAGKPA